MSTCQKQFTIQIGNPPVDGYWAFEETGSFPTRVDKTAAMMLATTQGDIGMNSTTGKIGNALAIASAPGVSSINPGGDPNLTTYFPPLRWTNGQFSICLWFKVLDWTNNYIIYPTFLMDSAGVAYLLQFKWRADLQSLQVSLLDFATVGFNPASFAPVLNTWYFLHVFFNGVSFGYSINNGAPTLAPGTPTMGDTTTSQFVRFFQQSNGAGLGDVAVAIDELAFRCSKVFSAAQLSFLYNGGMGQTWPLTGMPTT